MADAALLARVVNHVVNEENAMGAIRSHRYGFQVDTRIDGKRRRRVLHTREEAEATLALWEGRPRGPGAAVAAFASVDPAPAPSTTLGDVLDGWLVHKQAISGGKKMAMQGSRNSARRLSRAFTRGLPAMALSARLLDRFIGEGRARGLRPASINHDLRALKAALRWASDPDRGALLPHLPAKVRLIPEAKITGATVRRHIISPEDLERLLDASPPKVRAVFALCAFAGLRQAEALHLHVGDVDLERRLVQVHEKPEAGWSPKTHTERAVEMGPRLAAEMERYLATLPTVLREPGRWLFTSSHRPGQRLTEVKPQVTRAFKRAGISVPRAGCHTLRKTWATRAGELGDYEALREMGGWSSWQAMKHYVAASEERRRQIAERF